MRGRTLPKALIYLPVWTAFCFLILKAEQAADAAQSGMAQCARTVIPALFPVLVLTNILLAVGFPKCLLKVPGTVFERVFHIRKTAFPAFIAGLLGGYPLGAVAAAESCRLGGCSEEEAERLMVFANNCSPGFLFGVLGSRGNDGCRQALLLLILQYAVSIWLGVYLGIGHTAESSIIDSEERKMRSFPKVFTDSVKKGGRSVLLICAYVVFFNVVTSFLPAEPLLRGFFELTGGILMLETHENAPVIAAFLVGWGGLSVACQVSAALADSGIRMRLYLPIRLLHGLLMAASMKLIQVSPVLLLPLLFLLSAAVFVKKCRKTRYAVI